MKTELSETSVASCNVISPEYSLPKLRTWKISLSALSGTRTLNGAERNIESGPKPDSSATASVNGLKAEPGWRSASVARLNWWLMKSSWPLMIGPPTIARTCPVALSIDTNAAVGVPFP